MIVVLKAHISGTLSLSKTSVAMFCLFGQKTTIGHRLDTLQYNEKLLYDSTIYKYISVSGYALLSMDTQPATFSATPAQIDDLHAA